LQLHYYQVSIPILAVYPFKYNDRYSYLVINRDLEKSVKVQLDLPYTPSNRSLIVKLTGDDAYLHIDDSPEDIVHLNYTLVDDFTDNYTITLSPHSAYMIVNYAKGARVCLDEDGDGYGANIYELEDCSGSKMLVDPDDLNPNIHP